MFSVFPINENPYDTRSWPFMFDMLHKKSTQKILMSLTELHHLAESMEPELPVPVAAMATTGRSGSTLMSQMLNAIKGTRVLAENPSLNQVSINLNPLNFSNTKIPKN